MSKSKTLFIRLELFDLRKRRNSLIIHYRLLIIPLNRESLEELIRFTDILRFSNLQGFKACNRGANE